VKNFSIFSRHNPDAPQHRGVASGGTIRTGRAKSPKAGGLDLDGTDTPKLQETPSVGARPATPTTGTVAELRAECKRRGVKGYSRMKKAELLSILAG
jgi:hypothetical protein